MCLSMQWVDLYEAHPSLPPHMSGLEQPRVQEVCAGFVSRIDLPFVGEVAWDWLGIPITPLPYSGWLVSPTPTT